MTAIKLTWIDSGAPAFQETNEEPDGSHVFATWPQARQAAMDAAIGNCQQWASCIGRLNAMTQEEAFSWPNP